MKEIKREVLEVLLQSVGISNPIPELNYLYVDKENIVSTNLIALCIASHTMDVQKPFLIDRKIVAQALKIKKATYFRLFENKVMSLDKDHVEIMTYSVSSHSDVTAEKYPEYKRVIPNSSTKTISFSDPAQICAVGT